MNKMYIIENLNGSLVTKILDSTPFEDAGQKGWTIQTYTAAGVDYILLCADENADVFPLHKDPNEWFGFVVEGSGELQLGDTSDNISSTKEYNAGDIIIFKPDTFHGWKSASSKSKLMFVKPARN